MKRYLALAVALFTVAHTAVAQEQEPEPKTGWNFGPLPAIGYNSDLGFQYGVLCDIFWYGDGEVFPGYYSKFNVEVSRYTKGAGVFHLFYDSKYLFRNMRFTFAATYMPNKMLSFYGFNGLAAPYDDGMSDGNAFYSIRRNMTRVMADFQGPITDKWGWAAGASFWNYRTGRVGLSKYDNLTTLYDLYLSEGIIPVDQAYGGAQFELKVGIVFDTRDHEPSPSKGIWAEAILYGSPDIVERKGNEYIKLSAHFRHYMPVVPRKLTFAYHLAYQGTLWGTPPWYVQQNIATLYLRQINSEGLGGINTVRGVLYNRMLGNGYAWANLELRWRMFGFRFLRQEWYLAMNPFFDAGMVVQPYRLDEMKATGDAQIYSGRGEKLHMSAGAGLKAVMNRNFIISFEWGKPFEKQDGKSGMNVGLNYIF